MKLSINVREAQGISILDLDGRVIFGDEANALGDRVEELLGAGKKKILLNMGRVSYVDSNGLGKLVKCLLSCESKGGQLRLLKVNKNVLELLIYTALVTKFGKVYDDEAEALSSFQAGAGRAAASSAN